MPSGVNTSDYTQDLLLLATGKVRSVKRCHTITELVVVWSVFVFVQLSVLHVNSWATCIHSSTLKLFALAVVRSRKTSVLYFSTYLCIFHSHAGQDTQLATAHVMHHYLIQCTS